MKARIRQLLKADLPPDSMTLHEVVAATGATPRQLQHWDEHRYIRPQYGHIKHARIYSSVQIPVIRRLVAMRKAGIGMANARACLKQHGWMEVVVVSKPIVLAGVLVVPPRRGTVSKKVAIPVRVYGQLSDAEMDAIALRDPLVAERRARA